MLSFVGLSLGVGCCGALELRAAHDVTEWETTNCCAHDASVVERVEHLHNKLSEFISASMEHEEAAVIHDERFREHLVEHGKRLEVLEGDADRNSIPKHAIFTDIKDPRYLDDRGRPSRVNLPVGQIITLVLQTQLYVQDLQNEVLDLKSTLKGSGQKKPENVQATPRKPSTFSANKDKNLAAASDALDQQRTGKQKIHAEKRNAMDLHTGQAYVDSDLGSDNEVSEGYTRAAHRKSPSRSPSQGYSRSPSQADPRKSNLQLADPRKSNFDRVKRTSSLRSEEIVDTISSFQKKHESVLDGSNENQLYGTFDDSFGDSSGDNRDHRDPFGNKLDAKFVKGIDTFGEETIGTDTFGTNTFDSDKRKLVDISSNDTEEHVIVSTPTREAVVCVTCGGENCSPDCCPNAKLEAVVNNDKFSTLLESSTKTVKSVADLRAWQGLDATLRAKKNGVTYYVQEKNLQQDAPQELTVDDLTPIDLYTQDDTEVHVYALRRSDFLPLLNSM